MALMFLGIGKHILRSTEVQMARSKYMVLVVVMIALAVAVFGGMFGAVSFGGSIEGLSGLHW